MDGLEFDLYVAYQLFNNNDDEENDNEDKE